MTDIHFPPSAANGLTPGLPTNGEVSGHSMRLAKLAARLSCTLALARALVQGGRRLDLSGVEDGVGILCAQTLDLSPEEARTILPALSEVLGQIDLLSANLRAHPSPNVPLC